jgi:hypothetical protein
MSDRVLGCLYLALGYGYQFIPYDIVVAVWELVATLVGIYAGVEGPDL